MTVICIFQVCVDTVAASGGYMMAFGRGDDTVGLVIVIVMVIVIVIAIVILIGIPHQAQSSQFELFEL